MTKLRMDLIEDYYQLYRIRNLSMVRGNNAEFRRHYEKLSVMWLSLSDEERIAVNTRFLQDNLANT